METVKKRVLWLLLLLLPLGSQASHIVGGEFELIHLTGFQYRLNLVLYFDEVNGQAGAKDAFADVSIFRIADNARIQTIRLPLDSSSLVHYTQPECSIGALVTTRLFYSAVITLSSTVYTHPSGYYVSWERCCRNYNITNVVSLDPLFNPGGYAGQTFYLEFPPIMKDGQPFVDSTPRLFPPLSDYACVNKPYYTDFGGVDDDGDSLVYSLVPPLSTKTSGALPAGGLPGPKPYPNVTWRPPFSETNIVNGAPDLRVSTNGFLTVTPTLQGLFVFAVKVQEFRDGMKIGETRRDFQMLVIDCPVSVPPVIEGKRLGDPTYVNPGPRGSLPVFFDRSTPDEERCVNVRITDLDSQDPQQQFTERVRIKVIALNFNKDLSPTLPAIHNATLLNGSDVEFTVCFQKCPYLFGANAQIGIIAMDDACSLPLTDTLRISLLVEPPTNNPPRFISANPVAATLNEGDTQVWPWSGLDDDGDPIVVSVLTNGFSLATAGMQLSTLGSTPGAINGELKWDAFCDIYDFTHRTSFQVTVRLEDQDQCLMPTPVGALYNLNVILPGNADPIIDSDLTGGTAERSVFITRRLMQSLNFTVTGKDLVDNDKLVLSAYGGPVNPSLTPIAIAVTPVENRGTVSVPAAWNITCDAVDLTGKDKEDYLFRFIVVDNQNKCRIYKADTLDVNLSVLPPINQAPILSVVNQNAGETLLSDDVLTMTRGAAINLQFTGTDFDVTPAKDTLKIQLADQEGNVLPPQQYTFVPVKGTSPVQTNFTWTPDCSIFPGGKKEQEYTITFELLDDRCQTAKRDSLRLTLRIKDIDGSDAAFVPPNFVSPNGDSQNDYYAMEQLMPDTGELVNIMPLDNCESRFEYVLIYNRWGKEVFKSTERDFRWFPGDESAGVYFYSIKFTKKEYRGSLTVRY